MDSGVGGLSILKEIHRLLPRERTVYFGDRGNCPYGRRKQEEIDRMARRIIGFLLDRHQCKLVVIACNTITGSLIDTFRRDYPVPFVGVEPATRVAIRNTRSGHIGILATPFTIQSRLFNQTRSRYAGRDITVHVQPAPDLVEAVERQELDLPRTRRLLQEILAPLLASGVDQVVLGCTHFPFLIPLMESLVPPHVTIIDPSRAVAAQTRRILEKKELISDRPSPPLHRLYSSAAPIPAALLPSLSAGSYRTFGYFRW